MYFELNGGFESEYFDLEEARQACVPHEDGRPKHSVYVSTYRVLEHVPLIAMGELWLITRDGRGLALQQSQPPGQYEGRHHLYQELCPVHPLIASRMNAKEFCLSITDPEVAVSIPGICFVELATRDKTTRTVNRIQHEHIPYRCVKKGFFVGDQTGLLHYPFPSVDDMEKEHHYWWRSAELS